MYDFLNSPFTLRGVTLKNRLVFAPTTLGLSADEAMEKLGRIAKGGAASIILGDVAIEPARGSSLFEENGFMTYQKLITHIHEFGALAAAQLHMSDSDIKGMMKYMPDIKAGRYSPNQLRALLNDLTADYITSMPIDRIKTIIKQFGEAAKLAQKAGFDIIQIHGDRMCGSMSSSIYNHRIDEYGDSPENRARFACEAIMAVREAVPDMPIDYKLAIRQENPHYGNAGVLESELAVFVPLLEAAGADAFHVALANHSDLSDTIPPLTHPYFKTEGCFLKFCDEVRELSDKPLCGVGRLTHPDMIEKQLSEGRIQLAAMSRQLLADDQWLNKVNAGREKEIHYCMACNKKCLGGMQAHQGTRCIYDKN